MHFPRPLDFRRMSVDLDFSSLLEVQRNESDSCPACWHEYPWAFEVMPISLRLHFPHSRRHSGSFQPRQPCTALLSTAHCSLNHHQRRWLHWYSAPNSLNSLQIPLSITYSPLVACNWKWIKEQCVSFYSLAISESNHSFKSKKRFQISRFPYLGTCDSCIKNFSALPSRCLSPSNAFNISSSSISGNIFNRPRSFSAPISSCSPSFISWMISSLVLKCQLDFCVFLTRFSINY